MNPLHLIVIALTLALSGCITPPKLDPQQQTIANDHLGLSSQVSAPVRRPGLVERVQRSAARSADAAGSG